MSEESDRIVKLVQELPSKWYASHDNILEFAHVLYDASLITDTSELLYYFEKPWKWTTVRDLWIEMDKPRDGDDRWDEFFDKAMEL